ncbi:hypothetical protein B0H15DRAFT_1024875 [Mycena belliarum]|uniref:F-box domain-containing protein n=1 Tax=Mycena belliarum TaxID=1033014 RepID=A0AAD6XMF4_9AGAR|nr:hypothetical protein B0H15DRAFT_1024875 [Mycena belliae]
MPIKRRPTKSAVSVSLPPADSPFLGFLEQDRVPSPQERLTIQEMLTEKAAYLAHLNSKVPKRRTGRKIPRQLRVELEHTRRSIKYHQALISPWRRLPVEIMSEIFLFTLLDIGEDGPASVWWEDDRNGTLLLCKICRLWREIAISTPALWNILSFNLHDVSRPLDWVSTWLERSRSLPLYLQVVWNDRALPDVINPVISLFASHLHHIAGLWIDGLDIEDHEIVNNIESYPRPTFPPIESPSAPILSTLGVDLPPGSNWDWISAACKTSPCLSSLTTSQFSFDWFPVANLTKLHFFDPVSIATLLQVLEQAPHLQDISVDIKGPSTTSSSGSVLVMAAVSTLEITSADDHLGPFLDQVAFPQLKDFSIHQLTRWPDAELHSFLTRSSCALRALDLYDIEINETEIITTLRHKACDMLESLGVSECNPPLNLLLQHLTYDHHDREFPNPRLKTIELGDVLSEDGLVAELAESRVAPVIELRPDVSVPDCLERLRISFMVTPGQTHVVTHQDDWMRLSMLQQVWPEFEVDSDNQS